MKKNQIIILSAILFTLILAAGIVYFFYYKKGSFQPKAQVAGVIMSASPASETVQLNNTFDMATNIDTGGIATDSAAAVIIFDPNYLEVVDADANQAGIQINSGSMYPNVLTNLVDNNKITYAAGLALGGADPMPVTGIGVLATVKFKGKAITDQTNVTYNYNGTTDMDMSFILSHQAGNPNILGVQPAGGTYKITQTAVAPTVDLKIDGQNGTINKNQGESATLSWTSSNATACAASGSWTGSKRTSASESTGALNESKTYKLTCKGSGGTKSDTVSVSVAGATPPPAPIEEPIIEEPPPTEEPPPIEEPPTEEPAPTEEPTPTPTTTTTPTTTPSKLTPSTSDQIAKLPANIQPQTAPQPAQKSLEIFKSVSMKPWALWFLYAIIPAFIAGGTVYFYLRRKKPKHDRDVDKGNI